MSKTHLIKHGEAFVALSGDKYTLVAEPKKADLFTEARAVELATKFGHPYRAIMAPPPVYFSILGRMGGVRKTPRKTLSGRQNIKRTIEMNRQRYARLTDGKTKL